MTVTLESLDVKINGMHGDVKLIRAELETMNGRQREDHDKVISLEHKVNTITGLQAVLTLALSSVAGWIGWRD